ncbi:MAG: L-serine ammonia-lyase, iron-sulfur-dependent, subunit alpha [Lachnospiraceae bacterium]|nr:L-serine ammonia-lyase, iron-sulfur-dependent, subunit alpha [Lachnospiraceae bacterium]
MAEVYLDEQVYIDILKSELVPALGCTEPIALAYAAAKARQVLGSFPGRIEIRCSGNIIKNVKGVIVPNSGGLKGVDVAAVLGVVGGNADRELEVLEEITPEHIEKAKELISQGYFTCKLQENVANLYIVANVFRGEESASVTIVNRHTLITEIRKNGQVIYEAKLGTEQQAEAASDGWNLSVKGILHFAETVDTAKIKEVLDSQIELNSRIADEGLTGRYGSQVGRVLLDSRGYSVAVRARARAAAGSDARMGGCSLPVVINSGSGNQGMTVSLPVIEYAKEWNASEETLYRALAISNLVSVHIKHHIGSLSAFCGAVSAAYGTGAAITWLAHGSYEQIAWTIINTMADVGGIVCDGAKASCAAKIASAVDAAILAHNMSMAGQYFHSGEGFVQEDLEKTIRSLGYIGRVGMKETDTEILNIMLDQVPLE